MVLGVVRSHDHIGEVVALKATRPHRDGLFAKVLNGCALRTLQSRARGTAVIERRERAVVERVLARPLGAIKSRYQPGIGVKRMGAEASHAAVNVQLPCNAALVTGEALVADLIVGDVVPGAAFENAVLSEADDTVLRMEPGIHPLDDITNQRRLIFEFAERPQNPVAVLMTRQRKVLPTPDP